MFQKLDQIAEEYRQLNEQLSDPDIIKDHIKLKDLSKRKSEIQSVVELYDIYKRLEEELNEVNTILGDAHEDAEMKELAQNERDELQDKQNNLKSDLQKLLLPKDPHDKKNVILEIRAGTGGDEAALFAGDLLRMYIKYAEDKKWKIEILSQHTTGVGGIKEIITSISGQKVYSRLKYEGGVHRVQRVPLTEAQGRIHTSAVTVAVLPEAEEVDIKIDEVRDLRIDVFRSSGPGGQSVNTTDSAVRLTHIPTGIVISCQDEKSQHKNKSKALKILRARLFDLANEEQQEKISAERKKMVSTGDRSAKIRTYNYPQGRLTDHRVGLTLYRLEEILNGDLDGIIDVLTAHFQAEALKASSN
ncbi:peptide chain release factor 1 [candidate division CSSED10-310 bacterium]|uniref:Peptide chain release factor 1 n=1 Tax=candidate division CSSED10-310 bacterium TaxID=2855610 RepID=A0ABV6Z4R4_UNCC1